MRPLLCSALSLLPAALLLAGPSLLLAPRACAQTLEAPDDVREVRHRVDIALGPGVAEIEVRIALARSAAERAEIAYSLPLPEGASLVSAAACRASRCQRAGRTGTHRSYAASLFAPGRGRATRPVAAFVPGSRALEVRAAPLSVAEPIELVLRYVVPLEIHGGHAELVLPARSADPRLAPREVTLRAPGYAEPWIAERSESGSVPADRPVHVRARLDRDVVTVARHPGTGRARALVAEPARLVPHDVILAIDVSPSMLDVERGRTERAIAAILVALPAGSRVRALRFGARAEWVGDSWAEPGTLDAAELAAMPAGHLGSRTRYAALAPLVEDSLAAASSAPLVVIVGDGWLEGPDFTALAARGARVVVANLADTRVETGVAMAARAVPGTLALELGETLAGRAGVALSSVVAEPMRAVRLRREDGPTIEDAIASGESLEWSGADERVWIETGSRTVGASRATGSLGALLGARWEGPRYAIDPRAEQDTRKWTWRAFGGVHGALGGLDWAVTGLGSGRVSRIARLRIAEVEIRGVLSASVLRRMMRRQLGPRVRGCFANARAGRRDFDVRAELRLVLAHREVLAASVGGRNVDAALAACIVAGTDDLDVPPSYGLVVVSYPFVSEPEPRPEPVPLAPDLGALLDALAPPDAEQRELAR